MSETLEFSPMPLRPKDKQAEGGLRLQDNKHGDKEALMGSELLRGERAGLQATFLVFDDISESNGFKPEAAKIDALKTNLESDKAPKAEKIKHGSIHKRDEFWNSILDTDGTKINYKNQMEIWKESTNNLLDQVKGDREQMQVLNKLGIGTNGVDLADSLYKEYFIDHKGDVGYFANKIALLSAEDRVKIEKASITINETNEEGKKADKQISVLEVLAHQYHKDYAEIAKDMSDGIVNVRTNNDKFVITAKEQVGKELPEDQKAKLSMIEADSRAWEEKEEQRKQAASAEAAKKQKEEEERKREKKETQTNPSSVREYSEKDEKHTNNEDSMLVMKDKGVFMISDGMGGHASGDEASRIAVDTAREMYEQMASDNISKDEKLKLIKQALDAANKKIMEVSNRDNSKNGMGATASLVNIHKEGDEMSLLVGNIGDSRVYVLRDGKLEQLTIDHDPFVEVFMHDSADDSKARIVQKAINNTTNDEDFINFLRDNEGGFTDEALETLKVLYNNRTKSAISQVLGRGDTLTRIHEFKLEKGNKVLITSDGITDNMMDHEIEDFLKDNLDKPDCVELLTAQAKKNGRKPDDISAILIDPDELEKELNKPQGSSAQEQTTTDTSNAKTAEQDTVIEETQPDSEKFKDKIEIIGESVQGYTHKIKNLPNQDAIFTKEPQNEGDSSIIAIADGHGGAKHFRSEVGSKLAVETAARVIEEFIAKHSSLTHDEIETKSVSLPNLILSEWKRGVEEHLREQPFKDEEFNALRARASDGETSVNAVKNDNLLAYGSTILAAARTKDYTIYLQLGDGNILIVDDDGKVTTPFPTEEGTISVLESKSLCVQDPKDMNIKIFESKSHNPTMIQINSDGLDAFGGNNGLMEFASDIKNEIDNSALKSIKESLTGWLNQISNTEGKGSGDDVTLAIMKLSNTDDEN